MTQMPGRVILAPEGTPPIQRAPTVPAPRVNERFTYTPVPILALAALVVYLASDPIGRSAAPDESRSEPPRSQRANPPDAPSPTAANPESDSARRQAQSRTPATTTDPTFGSRPLPAPVRLETPVPFPEVTRRRMRARMREVLANYGYTSESDSFDLAAARLEIRRRLAALDARTASERIAEHPYLDLLGPLTRDLVPAGADRSGVRLFPVPGTAGGDTAGSAVPEPSFWSAYPSEIPEPDTPSPDNSSTRVASRDEGR